MKYLSYKEQLTHEKWITLTKKLKEKAGWKCQICEAIDKQLECHHKFYVRGRLAWEYADECFDILCEECHKKNMRRKKKKDETRTI